MKQALLLIDFQKDYFPGGRFPLWETERVLENAKRAIARAQAAGVMILHVQHIAGESAPFFAKETEGAAIHPEILSAAPDAPIITKAFADAFHETELEYTLSAQGIDTILVCGMMTHNCVTHTAISKSAEPYAVSILSDCCTTVSELMHLIALRAVSTRMDLVASTDALPAHPAG